MTEFTKDGFVADIEEKCLREIHLALTMRQNALIDAIEKLQGITPTVIEFLELAIAELKNEMRIVDMAMIWAKGKLHPFERVEGVRVTLFDTFIKRPRKGGPLTFHPIKRPRKGRHYDRDKTFVAPR